MACSLRRILMFRTQEDLELVLLHYIMALNKTPSGTSAVFFKGHREAETGVFLETFPCCGTQSSSGGPSSVFYLDWGSLNCIAQSLSLSTPIEGAPPS